MDTEKEGSTDTEKEDSTDMEREDSMVKVKECGDKRWSGWNKISPKTNSKKNVKSWNNNGKRRNKLWNNTGNKRKKLGNASTRMTIPMKKSKPGSGRNNVGKRTKDNGKDNGRTNVKEKSWRD